MSLFSGMECDAVQIGLKSTEHKSSSGADSYAASQEIILILRHSKVHHLSLF